MKPSILGAVALFVAGCGIRPSSDEAAIYEVKFQGTWTASSHPVDYPSGAALDPGSAHFSGILGAAHDSSYMLFREGGAATAGLISLSHTGSHDALGPELDAAANAGHAGPRFGTGIYLDVNTPMTASFEVSPQFPRVSFATMVAPSPDWFAGVADVDLTEGGSWTALKTIDVYAYDSGAYEGATYKAAEAVTSPQGMVTMNRAPPFVSGAYTTPVARVTFTLQP